MDSDFTTKIKWLVDEIDCIVARTKKHEIPYWKKAHYKAVKNWLSKYILPNNNQSYLLKAKGYVETIYHLSRVEDWDRIEEILSVRISEYEFHVQLGIWGLYKEQISIYSSLLGQIDSKWDCRFLEGIGNAYDALGNRNKAITYHQKWKKNAHKIRNKKEEGKALFSLGISLGNSDYFFSEDLVLAALDVNQKNIKLIKPYRKRTHYRAVSNWLTKYRPNNANNAQLEQLKGILEAFHHFCAVEAWLEAKRILLIRFDTPTNEQLHEQLQIWGYYPETIDLYTKLLGKLDSQWQSINITGLGKINNTLGNFNQAINYFQSGIKIAKYIEDMRTEGNILNNLGKAYRFINCNSDALQAHLESLSITQKIGDKMSEGVAISDLGISYSSIQDWKNAIYYLQKGLDITHSTDNKLGQLIALEGLSNFYLQQNNYEHTVEYSQQQLNLAREIGYRQSEGISLRNLAEAQKHFIDPSKSSQNLQLAFDIFKEIGDNYNLAYCYNIGASQTLPNL